MPGITDEYMKEMIAKTKQYTIVLLKPTSKASEVKDLQSLLWEHARRNFQLKADGVLPVVCPVAAEADLSGIGIFITTVEETRKIMDGDPAVMAGIFSYEVYPCRSFPGSSLP